MAQRVEALVEPELLVWARRRAGYDVEAVAKKARVSADRLRAWEEGHARPSVKQLRRIAHVYRRPIAVFYLPEPPADFTPIKDFRRAWGEDHRPPSPELLAEIDAAHDRRSIALELLAEENDRPARFGLRASIDDDPEPLAQQVRARLGISDDTVAEWDDARAAFNAWRNALEGVGILVQQMTTVASREARGFSISEETLPVVVANNHDPFPARSFTLIHELVHVAIHESGICDLVNHGAVEPFCNHVAGAVLVPARSLLADTVVRSHGQDVRWDDHELQRLSRTYQVSREVILRRLLIVGKTDEPFYRSKRKQLLDQYEQRSAEPRQTGPVPPSTVAVIRSGYYFSQLVLRNYSHGRITGSDVATYLGVRLKHVPRIEQLVFPARR